MFNIVKITMVTILVAYVATAHAVDPTRPAYLSDRPAVVAKKQAPLVPLTVSAIFYAPNRKLAIINNQILRVGELIEGARITDIERSHVTIQRRGQTQSLSIHNAASVKHGYATSVGKPVAPQQTETSP